MKFFIARDKKCPVIKADGRVHVAPLPATNYKLRFNLYAIDRAWKYVGKTRLQNIMASCLTPLVGSVHSLDTSTYPCRQLLFFNDTHSQRRGARVTMTVDVIRE